MAYRAKRNNFKELECDLQQRNQMRPCRLNPKSGVDMSKSSQVGVAQTVLSAVSQVGNLRVVYRPRASPAFTPCRLPVGDTADKTVCVTGSASVSPTATSDFGLNAGNSLAFDISN